MTDSLATRAGGPTFCARTGALEALLDELADRMQAGDYVDADACMAEHPEFADRLRNILPAMQLLAAFGGAHLSAPSAAVGMPTADSVGVLGDFQLIREIGRGGMGVVYEAVQTSLNRRVALKVLPFASILDERQLARFKNEARAAALLHHTNIVPVFSVGCERGVHYYAMQYIEGRSLAELLDPGRNRANGQLSNAEITRERRPITGGYNETHLAQVGQSGVATVRVGPRSTLPDLNSREYVSKIAYLGIQAAEALEHAHRHGVLHRDIKPANMMLDGIGNLWITDFGLARLESDAGMTMTGDLVGTLRYMSPEQAGLIPDKVDHRTDVYSLGITLYELLARRPAVTGDTRGEIFRRIAECELPSLVRIDRLIPRELETIILKAAARRPSDRYGAAQDLADDLRRLLDHKPIAARRASLAHRAGKWIRRHRSLVAIVAASLAFSVSVFAVNLSWRAAEQRQRRMELASQQREEALQAQRHLKKFAYAVDLRTIDELKLFRDAELVKAALEKHRRYKASPDTPPNDLRGFEWHYFADALAALDGKHLGGLKAHARQIYCLALSHRGHLLASCSEDARSKIWDFPSMQLRHTLTGHANDVNCAAFSPDDRTLATCSDDGTVRLWDVKTGEVRLEFPANPTWIDGGGDQIAVGVAYSPDGRTLATISRSEARLWDATTGARLATLPGRGLAFAQSHRVFATMPDHSAVVLWDVDLQRQAGSLALAPYPPTALNSARFNATDSALIAAGDDGYLIRWRLQWDGSTATEQNQRVIWTGPAAVESVRLSADGSRAATASRDGAINVWNVNSVPIQRVAGPYIHSDRAWTALFSPDEQTILTTGMDGRIGRWEACSEQFSQPVYWTPAYGPLSGAYSPDGERFLLLTPRARWNADGGELLHVLYAPPQGPWSVASRRPARARPSDGHDTAIQHYVDALAVAPHSETAALCGGGGVFLWDGGLGSTPLRRVVDWQEEGPPALPEPVVRSSAVYLSDQTLAVLRAGEINIVDLTRATVIEQLEPPGGAERVCSLASSPDGRQLAVGGQSGLFWMYDVGERRWHRGGRAAAGSILSMAFLSPDDSLAIGSQDATVVIWDLNSGRPRHQLIGHRGPVTSLAWTSSQKRLASAGLKDGGAVRLWDTDIGQQVCTLHTDPNCDLSDIDFARDGRALTACGVIAGRTAVVYRWRTNTSQSGGLSAMQ